MRLGANRSRNVENAGARYPGRLEGRKDSEITQTRPRVLYISGLNEAAAQGWLACVSGVFAESFWSTLSSTRLEALRGSGKPFPNCVVLV